MSHDRHLTNSVIMVRPIDFGFNEQTGLDNEFQQRPSPAELDTIKFLVDGEFDSAVSTLQRLNLETLILGKKHTDAILPDAVFPNNWFCTRTSGDLHIFPMKTQNRQDEIQVDQLKDLFSEAGYKTRETIDLRAELSPKSVLEGTGSIIFHHPSRTIFAAISERCLPDDIKMYSEQFNYNLKSFNSRSCSGQSIYHTNVLMSCGEDFVVIADEIVPKNEKQSLLETIESNVGEIISITEEQMTNHFCGNILQLEDDKHQPVIALSQSAYHGFTSKQRKFLESKGSLAVCNIKTIERIGGGSIRCMLAENFLPLINPL